LFFQNKAPITYLRQLGGKFDVKQVNKEMMEHLRIKCLKGDLKYFFIFGKDINSIKIK